MSRSLDTGIRTRGGLNWVPALDGTAGGKRSNLRRREVAGSRREWGWAAAAGSDDVSSSLGKRNCGERGNFCTYHRPRDHPKVVVYMTPLSVVVGGG